MNRNEIIVICRNQQHLSTQRLPNITSKQTPLYTICIPMKNTTKYHKATPQCDLTLPLQFVNCTVHIFCFKCSSILILWSQCGIKLTKAHEHLDPGGSVGAGLKFQHREHRYCGCIYLDIVVFTSAGASPAQPATVVKQEGYTLVRGTRVDSNHGREQLLSLLSGQQQCLVSFQHIR